MKRSSKNSFVSPTKSNTDSSSSSNNNNNNNNVNNNVNNKTPKKKSSSFQTPVKIVASTNNNNNNNSNSNNTNTPTIKTNNTPLNNNNNNNITNTTTTTTTTTNNSTPQGLMETNVKSINSELFTTIPKYISEYLNQFSETTEQDQYSLVIDYCYLNWSNNPFNEYDIYKYKSLDLEKIKDIIVNLVNNNILKEINIKDNVKIYSSIPWFKLINYVGLEIEIGRYEQQQLEIEKEKEKEKENKKQSKYNSVAPKNTLASIVATLSPSKPKENHLTSSSSSSSTKKRKSSAIKSTTTPIPFNLNQDIDNSNNNSNNDSGSKRFKVKTNNIKSSKYELSIDRELILISDEKKRLLKSIQEKREALLKFKSKSNSPISEQKKTVPNQQEEKRVEGLIYKWKKASQDAISLLQEKVIDYMGKQQQQQQSSVSNDMYKFDDRSVGRYKSSSEWDNSIDTDENDKQYQEEFKFDYFEKEIYSDKDKQPEMTSKLYIINQFGLNPKDLNYDEENDQFKKL